MELSEDRNTELYVSQIAVFVRKWGIFRRFLYFEWIEYSHHIHSLPIETWRKNSFAFFIFSMNFDHINLK